MDVAAGDGLLGDILEALDVAVIVADAQGSARHINTRARRLLGWEEPGDYSLDLLPLAAPAHSRMARDPGPWEEETTAEAGGRSIPVLVAKRPLPGGSLVLITDLRDVSSAIAERDRARQTDRAKTRSLHMVAHDLSGPITVLNGYVSLVMDGSISMEQLEPLIPMLGEQLTHMRRLVNVLLDTARLEEGRLELRLQPLDLVSFVDDVVRQLRPPETGHLLVVRREAEALPVLADPDRLDSIVRNVISNAVKYSPEGTSVTCTLRRDGGAELEVADEGGGIDSADLDRLFTRFGRLGALNGSPPGVGLGLFLSRELARLHGGDLVAASEVGRGSRFTLRLPLREPEAG